MQNIPSTKTPIKLLSLIGLVLIFLPNSFSQTLLDCQTNTNYVGGTVYMDYNDNSSWETAGNYSENGAENIVVKAYNNLGNLVGTTTTNGLGEWAIVVGNGVDVRVEFEIPSIFKAAPLGGSSKSQVAFATAPNCTVDFGVHDPIEYCQEDPEIAMVCHVQWWAAGTVPLVVSIDYSDGSNSDTDISGYIDHNHPIEVPNSETGNTWGIAYNKNTDLLYTSSTYKISTDVSPDGLGAIYYIDNSTNTGANQTVTTATLLTSLSAGTDPTGGEPWTANSGGTNFDAAFDSPGKEV